MRRLYRRARAEVGAKIERIWIRSVIDYDLCALVFTAVLLLKSQPGVYPDEHWTRVGCSVAERFLMELDKCKQASGRR